MKKVLRFLTLAAMLCIPWVTQAQQALPYSYGFENNDLSADGWILSGSTSSNTRIYNETAPEGSYLFKFHYSEHNAHLISPLLTGTENGVTVTFKYMRNSSSSSYAEKFKVGYTTDADETDPTNFTYGDEIVAAQSWLEYENNFPAGTKRIAIKYIYIDGMYLRIDDFHFLAPPSCVKPTLSNTVATTNNTATITWTPSDVSQTLFDIFWSTSSTAPTEVTVPGASNQSGTSYTISDLDASTDYYVWIRGNCGTVGSPDISGGWTSAVSFKTKCAPTDLPYGVIDFNSLSEYAMPDCWTMVAGRADGTSSGSGAYSYSSPLGAKHFRFGYGATTSNVVTPAPLSVEANTTQIEFYAKAGSSSYNALEVGYLTNSADASTFVAIRTLNASEYTSYPASAIKVPMTSAPNGATIAFRFQTTGSYQYWYIDDVTIDVAPSCVAVTPGATTNITTTGATLHWTSTNAATTTYTITDGDAIDVTTAAGATSHPLTGLTPGTAYTTLTITANCDGSEHSDPVNVPSFSTAYEVPFTENFTSTPTGWIMRQGLLNEAAGTATLTGTSGWSFNTSNSVFDNHAYCNIYGNYQKWLIMPAVLMEDNVQLTFDLALTTYSGSGSPTAGEQADDKFIVLASTDNMETWTVLRKWDNAGSAYVYDEITNSATGQAVAINLSVYDGQSVIIAFYGESTVSGGDNNLHIDNVSIDYIPSCPVPTDVACTGTTTTTATFSWTENGTATAWQICINGDEANPINATTNPFTVTTGLTPSTAYTAKVRANCGGDYSEWSTSVVNFTTACEAIAADGYTQNFDSYSPAADYTPTARELPVCWNYINECTYSSYKYYPSMSAYSPGSYAHSGSNYLKLYSYYSSWSDYDPQPQYAILPEMTGLSGKQVTLWAKGYDASSTFKIGTMSNPANAATFTEIAEQTLTSSYAEYEFYVPNDATGAYLAIMIDAANSSRTTNSVYIDDIAINEAPTCRKPSGLMLNTPSARTAHTATLKWTNGEAGQTAWQIAYSTESAFDPNSVTPVDVTTNPATLDNLTASTTYYAYVRANCGDDGYSAWCSTRASFTTYSGVRVPTGLAVDNATLSPYAATVTWTGDPANDLHDSYELFYSQNSTPSPNNETVPSFTDIDTESKLIVGLTPGTTYYVWVRDNCGADGISAWTSPVVSFTTPEVCPAPTGVTVSSATAHGATISWTGTSDSYNVYVGKVTLNSDSYDFEDNAISPNFTNDPTRPWTVTTDDKHAGTYAVKSAGGFSSTQSDLTLTVTLTDDATLTFWDKASSENSWDYGRFLIDGLQKYETSGTSNSWTKRSYELTAGSHTLVWRYYKDGSGNSGDDCYYVDDITITSLEVASWARYEAPASPYVLFDDGNIEATTDYAVKVVGVCDDMESPHESAVVYFTTSADCDASNVAVDNIGYHSADITWDGNSDAGYTVWYRTVAFFDGINEEFASNSIPTGWTRYNTLLNDNVLNGTTSLSTYSGGWTTTSYALGSYNLKLNIYGTNVKYWAVTPATTLPANADLNFDLALTDFGNADPIEDNTAQADDRFVVLISTNNMASWTILREWNNSGSSYVYNNIATAGEHVNIDLSAYAGRNVRIAFYGESTVDGNGDNDLHIDNVTLGIPVLAGEWEEKHVDAGPAQTTIEDLLANTKYEVKVSPNCDPSIESDVAEFTTLALPTISVMADKWYAFSTPMHDAGQNYESISHISSNIITGTYDFLRYDEPTSTWQSQKSGAGHTGFTTLELGRGYIYRRATDAVLKVDGVPNTGNIVVPITKAVDGWNLIGNPFMTPIQLNSTYIDPSSTAALLPVTNSNSSCGYKLSTAGVWNVVVFNTSSIAAGEAVLVKASTTGTLILRPTASKGASAAEEESDKGIVFSVSNDKFTDVAYAMFADGEGLPKISHLNPEAPMLSIGGYAIATLDENTERFPMSFSGQGRYTLALKENSAATGYLHLIDRATGSDIDLLTTPEYTFFANGNADRFEVRLMPGMDENGNVTFVRLDGSRLIVDGEGELQVFDVMGRQLGSAQVSGTTTLDRSELGIVSAGVYVMRLDGNTQKIVVK